MTFLNLSFHNVRHPDHKEWALCRSHTFSLPRQCGFTSDRPLRSLFLSTIPLFTNTLFIVISVFSAHHHSKRAISFHCLRLLSLRSLSVRDSGNELQLDLGSHRRHGNGVFFLSSFLYGSIQYEIHTMLHLEVLG